MTPVRPLIGVTTSEMRDAPAFRPTPEGDPPQREMALGIVYLRAIERAGGLPVVIPPLGHGAIPALLGQLAGVCLSGGPDLHPDAYGAPPHLHLGDTEPELDAFELGLARAADEAGVPVLGICRGAQAMNVARGGTLHQHLPDVAPGGAAHRQSEAGRICTHNVKIRHGSRLRGIIGSATVGVNSFHHQAVQRLGTGLQVSARAPDGVVEAIEDPSRPLFLGVQWHAEALVDRPEQLALFEELVAVASAWQSGAGAERAA
jgi:putative glutamine amidotransferase